MNRIALYFASGESLYLGVILFGAVVIVSPLLKSSWHLRIRNALAWMALALMVMASLPVSPVADLIFIVFVFWFVSWNRPHSLGLWAKLRLGSAALLMVLLFFVASVELYQRSRMFTGKPSDHLVVIGDSLSSGVDPRIPAWPLILQQTTGITVRNLALPGAGVREALAMAGELTQADRVVVIEIGGNDLLGGTPTDKFRADLDLLLSKVAAQGRAVAMFELPLLPYMATYGRIQRRLSAKHCVWLLPKRYFTQVLADADATSDGLHLSASGSRHMAELIARVLSPVLRPL